MNEEKCDISRVSVKKLWQRMVVEHQSEGGWWRSTTMGRMLTETSMGGMVTEHQHGGGWWQSISVGEDIGTLGETFK